MMNNGALLASGCLIIQRQFYCPGRWNAGACPVQLLLMGNIMESNAEEMTTKHGATGKETLWPRETRPPVDSPGKPGI